MILPEPLRRELIEHAQAENPDEVCGILAGQGDRVTRAFRARNTEQSPVRYEIDPHDLIRIFREIDDADLDHLGIYHSHTHTQPFPSPTDIAEANPFLGDIVYVLVSLRTARQPFVYRGMSRDQWQHAHDFAQTRPARPEVCGFHIRDGRPEQVELRITRGRDDGRAMNEQR